MIRVREYLPLAPYTTIRLGGPARYFCSCYTADDVREALEFARRASLPIHILGGGSNVVFADTGFAGLVAHVTIPGLRFQDYGDSSVIVEAGAGVVWDDLVAQAVAQRLGGIECLSGIPGTVGGAPIQNIGAYGQEIADSLLEVDCLDRKSLARVTFTREQCAFAYRTSRFKAQDRDRYVVLAVRLRLPRGTRPTLGYPELIAAVERRGGLDPQDPTGVPALVRDTVLELRRGKSMVIDPADPNTRSVGSFFMNPVIPELEFAAVQQRWRAAGHDIAIPTFPAVSGIKIPAAWLIEQAGYRKGHQRDGVGLSTRHALALVNRGGTSAQLLALAEEIEGAVFERFGVRLEREAVVVAG